MKTIKQVAKLSGISVRTLQYYDQINLLMPSTKTDAGYRLYSDTDIRKLRQILFLKTLGFQLKEIQDLVKNQELDRRNFYHNQKELLLQKQKYTNRVVEILECLEGGATLDDCADEIEKLARISESTNKVKPMLLVLFLLIIGGGLLVFCFVMQRSHESIPITSNTTQNLEQLAKDSIYFNEDIRFSTDCLAIDVRELDVRDEERIISDAVVRMEELSLPGELKEKLIIQAYYGLSILSDGSYSKEYDQLLNYAFKTHDDERSVYIGFSKDREPIREIYAPNGELSTVSGQKVLLARVKQPKYIDGSYSDEEITERYYADFILNGYNYTIETQGLNEQELLDLLKSILES